jgi:hypothetical protein
MGLFGKMFRKKRVPDDEFAQDVLYREYRAGMGGTIPVAEDAVRRLNRDGYNLILHCPIIFQPASKVAEKVGMMRAVVIGEGERPRQIQRILNSIPGVGDGFEWLAFSRIEGMRALEHRNVRKGKWKVPDFRGAGRRKLGIADGTLVWTGWQDNNIAYMVPEGRHSGVDVNGKIPEEFRFDRSKLTIVRPGAGENPNGDLERGVILLIIADAYTNLQKAMKIYNERYSLPREIFHALIDSLPNAWVPTKLRSAAEKLATANSRDIYGMSDKDKIDIIEPKGKTWEFLNEYSQLLSSQAHRIITGEDVSSGKDIGDREGADSADRVFNRTVLRLVQSIEDAITADLLPWIEKSNADTLAAYSGDEPIRIELRTPVERRDMSPAEAVQLMDRGLPFMTDEIYEMAGKERPPNMPDVFYPVFRSDAEVDSSIPNNTGTGKQRRDREQEGSNIPDDVTRKRDKNTDKRKLKSDSDDGEEENAKVIIPQELAHTA